MKALLFGAVVCILISSRRIASATGESTNTLFNYSTDSTSTPASSSAPPNTLPYNFSSTTSTPVITTTEPFRTCTDPQNPKNTSITINKTSVITKWSTAQTDAWCIPTQLDAACFAMEKDNKWGWNWVKKMSVTNITLSWNDWITELYIGNLSEFTNYTCNITLEYGGIGITTMSEIVFQTKQEVPSEPMDVIITDVTATSFTVNWQQPRKNPGLLKGYHIEIFDLGAKYFVPSDCPHNTSNVTVNTPDEVYVFRNASPHHEYQVLVWAENTAGNGAASNASIITNSSASPHPDEVQFISLKLNSQLNLITGNLTWKMPCETNGHIRRFAITLMGSYELDPSVQYFKTFAVDAANKDEYFTSIEDIYPASKYTLSISADGDTVNGSSYSLAFSTEENVPGPPIINDITDIGPDYFVIMWSEPEINAGNITEYEVNITALEPLYDIEEPRCSMENAHYSEIVYENFGTYNFTKGLPYYRYQILITAFTSKGGGEPSGRTAETTPSVPEQPADFDFQLKDNVTGVLSWKTPCKSNGPVTSFTVNVTGVYTDNSSISTKPYERIVEYVNVSLNYTLTVVLQEAFNYTAAVWITSNFTDKAPAIQNITTPDGFPGPPNSIALSNIDARSFTINWEPPMWGAGRIQWYRLKVSPFGPLYHTRCDMNDSIIFYDIQGDESRTYRFLHGRPFYNYSVSIEANTTRGYGDSTQTFVVTNQSVPENVEIRDHIISSATYEDYEEYDANVTIPFKEPCFINGPMLHFKLNMRGRRLHFPDDIIEDTQTYNNTFRSRLRPDYDYTYTITTSNQYFSNRSVFNSFRSPSGVPTFTVKPSDFEIEMGSDSASIVLRKEYFDEANGDIKYIAILLTDMNVTGGYIQDWNGVDWPTMSIADTETYFQLTENYWNPFEDQDNFTFDIGKEIKCGTECTKPLERNKEYYLIIRLFTEDFYRNSPTIHFRFEDVSKLGVILGIIFGLLAAAIVGTAGFFAWRKNMFKLPPLFPHQRKSSCNSTQITSFTIQKFPQYCKGLENNHEKLTEQYTLLAERTKEVIRMHTTHYAELTENRRKNRYTNILPYDDTRVKLLIDEDDEIGSDYINASYIKGYSDKVEYIATQGPLPTTCRDFWKMVIQENVSIIVMVTQFIEQNKEKCYKYFPNNHESMIVGEDIEVRCSMELHFGTYCVRTIQVKKDITQVSVTHMQYLDWPDFNVPRGTETMLQFCCQLRDRLNIEGGCVIVHCSAGVGRTGTLIATDILLQNVNAGKNIDIFNTVLELRKQRTNMVQTQKQYMYIYNLIKDFLEHSQTPGFNENLEHVYENVSVLKMKQDDDNLIAKEKQTESQF